MDTGSALGTTVQNKPNKIKNMTPQQNIEIPKVAPLGISYGCLKVDAAH